MALPFTILGLADDGNAYFLDRHGRILSLRLDSLSQNKLLMLAPLPFWETHSGDSIRKGGIARESWMKIFDEIIEIAGSKDFDLDNIRGRGAWRESNGICYHDGITTTGIKNTDKLYIKKRQIDIGINNNPATKEDCQLIGKIVSILNFDTKLDVIRCLSWSILSPFSGALPWRPALLVTGESGSGKTTIVDYVIKPLANPYVFNGGDTSVSYIRNKLNKDSCAVVVEELEADTNKKRQNREEIFSMIRQSTSDDAPISGKATRDGGIIEYTMKNMFCAVAVSPEIEAIADENRIFRINIKPKQSQIKWTDLQDALINNLTPEKCASIRALTWSKLPKILEGAKILSSIIQEITKKDTRSSYADGLLLSAYFLIWKNQDTIDETEAQQIISEIFSTQEKAEKRDETEELLQRILAEPIYLSEQKRTMSLIEILNNIKLDIAGDSDLKEYKRTAGIYGITVMKNGDVGFQIYNHKISAIIDRQRGYDKILRRHKKFIEAKNCNIFGVGTHKCLIISGLLDNEEEKKNVDTENFDWDMPI